MILGFFFLFHFLEALSGREGFFAKKGGVSLVRNRDLRPAAKANPTIQQALKGSKSTTGSRTSPKAHSTSTLLRAEASFGFWGIQSSLFIPSQRKRWRTISSKRVQWAKMVVLMCDLKQIYTKLCTSSISVSKAANPPGYLLSDIKRRSLSSLLTGDLNEIVRDAIFTR